MTTHKIPAVPSVIHSSLCDLICKGKITDLAKRMVIFAIKFFEYIASSLCCTSLAFCCMRLRDKVVGLDAAKAHIVDTVIQVNEAERRGFIERLYGAIFEKMPEGARTQTKYDLGKVLDQWETPNEKWQGIQKLHTVLQLIEKANVPNEEFVEFLTHAAEMKDLWVHKIGITNDHGQRTSYCMYFDKMETVFTFLASIPSHLRNQLIRQLKDFVAPFDVSERLRKEYIAFLEMAASEALPDFMSRTWRTICNQSLEKDSSQPLALENKLLLLHKVWGSYQVDPISNGARWIMLLQGRRIGDSACLSLGDYLNRCYSALFAINKLLGGGSEQEVWLNLVKSEITGDEFEEIFTYYKQLAKIGRCDSQEGDTPKNLLVFSIACGVKPEDRGAVTQFANKFITIVEGVKKSLSGLDRPELKYLPSWSPFVNKHLEAPQKYDLDGINLKLEEFQKKLSELLEKPSDEQNGLAEDDLNFSGLLDSILRNGAVFP